MSDYWPIASSHNVRILLPDTGTTAFDRLALGLCTVRWHPNACTLTQGHTGVHRAADGSALVATHGSGDLGPQTPCAQNLSPSRQVAGSTATPQSAGGKP